MAKSRRRRGQGGRKCNSPRKKGRGRCPQPAGWGTAHPGTGRCKFHGGLKKGGDKRLKHGLRSMVMREVLKKRLLEWKDAEAKAIDLSAEIATLRMLAEHLTDRPEAKFDVEGFLKVLERLIRAVDVQQRAQRQGMVSLATIERYVEAIGLVIAKHVKDHDVLTRIEADARAIPLLAG